MDFGKDLGSALGPGQLEVVNKAQRPTFLSIKRKRGADSTNERLAENGSGSRCAPTSAYRSERPPIFRIGLYLQRIGFADRALLASAHRATLRFVSALRVTIPRAPVMHPSPGQSVPRPAAHHAANTGRNHRRRCGYYADNCRERPLRTPFARGTGRS